MAADRHHDSAICHIAAILLTRIATCWRTGQPYHSATSTAARSPKPKAAASSREHHQVDRQVRINAAATASQRLKNRTGREQRSRKALQHPGPPTTKSTSPSVA